MYLLFGIILITAIAFLLSLVQVAMGSKAGSDHPVHIFLVDAIRSNDHRLFSRIPRILNSCYNGAITLYLHWALSYFGTKTIFWTSALLNPLVNALHVFLFSLLATAYFDEQEIQTNFVIFAALAFALTPQFFHAFSARNFGLSARGSGLLLTTVFFTATYYLEIHEAEYFWWIVLCLSAWLIWGVSTFAQQAIIFISVVLFLTTGRTVPILGTLLGLFFFILIHPEYSLGYIKYTIKFLRAYSKELASIFILEIRPSIWGDWVWDIWVKIQKDPFTGLVYAYGNSVTIAFLLNPFVVFVCWQWLTGQVPSGLASFAAAITLSGVIVTLMTSLRPLRFLGEPERYVEIITPWAVLCGTYLIYFRWGFEALFLIIAAFTIANLAQLFATFLLMKKVKDGSAELENITETIKDNLDNSVRFCSNNEQLTKMFMNNFWKFAFFWVAGQKYCGMTSKEAFTKFPNLKREACQRIASTYKVNAVLLDRKLYDTLFDTPPPGLEDCKIAYVSERYSLLILTWETE